jgi:DNA polymerase-3 subunit delta
MAALTFDSLREQLSRRKYSPIYLLHGEEGFFIDELLKDFDKIIPDEEKDFNQYTVYFTQTPATQVIDMCNSIPMMADRQLVILKEAQATSANEIDRLAQYVAHPNPANILVICFRGAKAKGSEFLAACKNNPNVVTFESKPLRDYNIRPVITAKVKDYGLNIDQPSTDLLCEYIGTDLSRLFNEIHKLSAILPRGASITPEVIEKNIGISKDFNNFELVDAIAARDTAKIYRIATYFQQNPKNNPLVVTASTLFGFFADLLILYFSKDKSERGIMEELKLKYPFQAKKYVTALRNYNAFKVIEIIAAIRDFDRKSKGAGSRQGDQALFRDLLFHILNASGDLGV